MGPPKNSTPTPGYMAKCVPDPVTLLTAPVNAVLEMASLLVLKSMNPTFPVRKARTGPDVPIWNLGPKRPISGRSVVRENEVVAPLPEDEV